LYSFVPPPANRPLYSAVVYASLIPIAPGSAFRQPNKKVLQLHEGLSKRESALLVQIRQETIGLKDFLFNRRMPEVTCPQFLLAVTFAALQCDEKSPACLVSHLHISKLNVFVVQAFVGSPPKRQIQ
ncbi:hypothetical protein IQ07DRAFT_605980, partial [Pyrenochaeta sp. DS3sAY3a]